MTTSALLPTVLRTRLTAFISEHRRLAPGFLDRVVVTGSATAGDWWEGTSDIDLVLVIRRAPSQDELVALGELHRSTISEGPVDGVYLTEQQLAEGPDTVGAAPQVVEGALDTQARGTQLTWVTWREVESGVEGVVDAVGAITWMPSARRFPGAEEGARAFSRHNLRDYWQPLGIRARAQLFSRCDSDPVDPVTVRWIALGPARLVATIETGDVISKSASGAFAAERWPAHAEFLLRAVASRTGEDIPFTVADARQALDLLDQCVEITGVDGR
ncbi:nucleotidyltransferase domain-containing protein [Cryobacterium melibiosiphilum]|uniref:Nucleotidyltransferase domain-containing protein n=1 Tax=Cryobacterium melibiosiphilum TaxID=995039 RepID=A0A3A5MT53_9MICO|nr:nucleotidyltransferase domain-containing protein [Cryobacterium melibiosiphilum]